MATTNTTTTKVSRGMMVSITTGITIIITITTIILSRINTIREIEIKIISADHTVETMMAIIGSNTISTRAIMIIVVKTMEISTKKDPTTIRTMAMTIIQSTNRTRDRSKATTLMAKMIAITITIMTIIIIQKCNITINIKNHKITKKNQLKSNML